MVESETNEHTELLRLRELLQEIVSDCDLSDEQKTQIVTELWSRYVQVHNGEQK